MAAEKAGSIPLALVLVLVIVAAWILHKVLEPKAATGDVTLGDPTVTGDSVLPGTDVYFSRRTDSIELDPSNPAIDPLMRQKIWESNNAIAADDAAEE